MVISILNLFIKSNEQIFEQKEVKTTLKFQNQRLPVRFSNSFKFVLLFDTETVTASFSRVHELIRQALSNGFNVPECSVLSACRDQPDGLVDPSHWRNIASLSSCTENFEKS